MAHGTHEHSHYGEPGAKHAPVVNDPEHDINARSATIWFVAGAIVVFFTLWIMVPIFVRVLEAEREHKVNSSPNTELLDVKEAEQQFLKGSNPTKKSIDQVLQQLAGK